MKEFVVASLAIPVGAIWREMQEHITAEKDFYVSSPLSSTPMPVYQWVLEHANTFPHWEKVKFVLMDEMVEGKFDPFSYISSKDPASYEGFAKRNFLDTLEQRVGIALPVLKPELHSIKDFSVPLDLLILALGVKGNYANVMPNTQENTGWHIAHLIPEFRQAHTQKGSASYEGAEFREYGMSLGPQQVLLARRVVVIVSGEKKKGLLQELKSFDSFHPEFPLSIIYHPDVTNRVELYITPELQS